MLHKKLAGNRCCFHLTSVRFLSHNTNSISLEVVSVVCFLLFHFCFRSIEQLANFCFHTLFGLDFTLFWLIRWVKKIFQGNNFFLWREVWYFNYLQPQSVSLKIGHEFLFVAKADYAVFHFLLRRFSLMLSIPRYPLYEFINCGVFSSYFATYQQFPFSYWLELIEIWLLHYYASHCSY